MTTIGDCEFIDAFVSAAEEKSAASGTKTLSLAEKHAVSIWAASGAIGNGSFQYFFENSLSAEDAADAYEAIGMPKLANIFRTALSLFPNGKPHSDWHEALAFLREKEELFDKLAAEIYRADVEMTPLLAQYLRKTVTQ
jgi:hypothetical protein